MDYTKANNADIDGSGNIVLQDMDGESVTINYNDTAEFTRLLTSGNERLLEQIKELIGNREEANQQLEAMLQEHLELPAEVRQEKERIMQKVTELRQFVQLMQSGSGDEDEELDEDRFEDVDFDELALALENESVVLFLGPELSVDSQGNSLHRQFFESLSGKKLKYNPDDDLFLPGSMAKLINRVSKFYTQDFIAQNRIGNALLKKLAQIPFKLIVSVCPDDSMSRIFSQYNIDHNFLVYDGTELSTDAIEWDKPVVFNALGNAAQKGGKYIFTHHQFDEYLKQEDAKRIPPDLEARIQEATSYLFIGFDFNKWYYRLLMFSFKFMEESERYALGRETEVRDINRDYFQRQFGMNFIDGDYEEFVKILLQKSKEEGLSQSLNAAFVESVQSELEALRVKAVDADKLEALKSLGSELDALEQKIIANKS